MTTYTHYPIFKDSSGEWRRSTTPVIYGVEKDSGRPECLLFSIDGNAVSKYVERDRKYEHVFKNLKTKIKAIGGADGLLEWFTEVFNDEGSPFHHLAMHLIEKIVEGRIR